MYAKTINVLCAAKNVFVKYQAQGGGVTATPCVRPCVDVMYLYSKYFAFG